MTLFPALGCYNKNVMLFNYLNNKLFSHEFELWRILGKQKKLSDKNQSVDWIKSIHRYRLVNVG